MSTKVFSSKKKKRMYLLQQQKNIMITTILDTLYITPNFPSRISTKVFTAAKQMYLLEQHEITA